MSTPTLNQLRATAKIVRTTTSKYRDGDKAINEVFHRASDGTYWLSHRCASDEHDVTIIKVAPLYEPDGLTVKAYHEVAE